MWLKKKRYEWKTDLWRLASRLSALFWIFFPRPTRGLLLRTDVFSFHPSPQAWGVLNTHQHRFFSCCYETWPQGGSISPQSFFFFFFFFCCSRLDFCCLFSVNRNLVQLYTDYLFFFRVFSHIGYYSVSSRRPCANSRSFGIFYLIISSVCVC